MVLLMKLGNGDYMIIIPNFKVVKTAQSLNNNNNISNTMNFEEHVDMRSREIAQRIREKGRAPALKVFKKWKEKEVK